MPGSQRLRLNDTLSWCLQPYRGEHDVPPYQVIIHLTDWHRKNLIQLLNDRERLRGYRLWGGKRHGLIEFEVAHFSTKEDQEEFIRLCGGVPYDPTDKKSKPWETYFEK